MRGQRALALTDLGGGVNLRDAPWDIGDNQSPTVVDFQPVGLGGAIAGRQGDIAYPGVDWTSVAAGDFGGQAFSVPPAVPANPHVFVSTLSSAFLDVNVAGSISVVESTPAGATGDEYAFVLAPVSGGQGPYYYVRPTSPRVAKQTAGGGAGAAWTASAGTVPPAYLLLNHGNRVWAARTDAIGDGVWWSELGDPRNWPAANVNRFGIGDGEVIRAIGSVGSNIVVFKASRAWLIYDLDTGANRPLGPYGSQTSRVLETPYGLVFSDLARGICVTDGVRVDPIGDALGAFNDYYALTYVDDSLFVAASINTGIGPATNMLEYRFKTQTWWRHTAPGLSDFVASENHFYGIRSVDTKLWAFGQGVGANIGGDTITPRWRSRYFRLGDSQTAKRIRSVELAGEGVLTVNYRKDQSDTIASTHGPYTLPTTDASSRQRIPDLGVAYSVQVEVAGSSADPTQVRLDELSLRMTQRRD